VGTAVAGEVRLTSRLSSRGCSPVDFNRLLAGSFNWLSVILNNVSAKGWHSGGDNPSPPQTRRGFFISVSCWPLDSEEL
jgi:hypothetical protein